MVESWLTEQWAARDGRIWAGSRVLGARPGTEADTETWRRDGSPTEWAGVDPYQPPPQGSPQSPSQASSRNPSQSPSQGSSRNPSRGSSQGREGALSASPGKGVLKAVTGRAAFSMAGRDMTFEQIQELSADPAALKKQISAMVRGVPGGSGGSPGLDDDSGGLDAGVVADALSGLLWSKPSSPEVRAAAYRALAELPNVRYLGTATDERGRKGAAFSFTVPASSTALLPVPPPIRRTLIIDVVSSRVLSSTDTGGPGTEEEDEVEVVLEAGWTDDEPAPPALP
ncbi:hypothetical protein [Streptosporangium vulgare]|uniref:hypothetical protein n=1 Tax=Streptosporangium vulgare TaxID=46190 RepID=UPI0031D37E8A